MNRYKIFIRDSEQEHGGIFYMETIEAIDEAAARIRAEELYGENILLEEKKP